MRFREMEKNDFDNIRILYRDVHKFNYPIVVDKWKFLNNPYGICPTTVADDNGILAGLYTVLPVEIKLGDQIVLGAQSFETMTHPNYRKQGIFKKLALLCYDIAIENEYKVLYGIPNKYSYNGFIKHLNWDHTGNISKLIRPIKISKYNKVPKIVKPLSDIIVKYIPKGKMGNYQIIHKKPDNKSLENILKKYYNEDNTSQIYRDVKWINWRYHLDSGRNYHWISAYRDNILEAIAIIGIKNVNENNQKGTLVELVGSSNVTIETVLYHTIKYAEKKEVSHIETFSNNVYINKMLKKAFFISYKKVPFIVRKLTVENLGTNIHDHDSWRIFGGDIDTL